jgi:hypothetical protein
MRILYSVAGLVGFIAATVLFLIYGFATGMVDVAQQLNVYGACVGVGVPLALAAAFIADVVQRRKFKSRRPEGRLALASNVPADREETMGQASAVDKMPSPELENAA